MIVNGNEDNTMHDREAAEDDSMNEPCPRCGSDDTEERAENKFLVGEEEPVETYEWKQCNACGHSWDADE